MTDINSYLLGVTVRVRWVVTDLDGVLLDPDTMEVILRVNGSNTTFEFPTDEEIVRDSQGSFYMDVDTLNTGRYRIRVKATDNASGAKEHSFKVLESTVL